jgi:hypothetical protein
VLVSASMTSAQPRFRLYTKHKPELLFALMRTLAHADARISFEGRLSYTELAQIAGASLSETEVLKRNTILPGMDFVVLPLTPETVPEIKEAIVSKVAFKDYAGIVHVQIERQGRLAFVACDHFHEDWCLGVRSSGRHVSRRAGEKPGSLFLRTFLVGEKSPITLIDLGPEVGLCSGQLSCPPPLSCAP